MEADQGHHAEGGGEGGSVEMKRGTAGTLATLRPEAAPTIPALRKLVADEAPCVRMEATYVPARIGRAAQEA